MQGRFAHSVVAFMLLFQLCSERVSAQEETAVLYSQQQFPGLVKMAESARQRPPEPWPVRSFSAFPQGRSIENSLHSYGMSNSRLDVVYPLQLDAAIREGGVNPWERRLAIAQGSYYVITGLWPILHMKSFEKVTGPKTDDWLVKTVGAMITVVGGTLLISGLDGGPSNDMKLVAVGSAAALAAVDVTYVAQGRISRIYLLDAVAELALIIGWGLTAR